MNFTNDREWIDCEVLSILFVSCYVTPILASEEEMMKENEARARGEAVRDVPAAFKEWVRENEDRIRGTKVGSLPYFIRYNMGVVEGILGGEEGIVKKGRRSGNEAYEAYEDDTPITITDEQRDNIRDVAKSLGMELGKPMSFNDADGRSANVDYHKGENFKDNCQSCVLAFEARLRGLDITALEYVDKKGSTSYMLGANTSLGWLNSKGKVPELTHIGGRDDEEKIERMEKEIKGVGRYHIGINFDDDTGHIITAEKLVDGRIIYYDPQNGEFVNIKSLTGLKSFEVLRVDRLLFNKEYLSGVVRSS